MLNSYDVVIVGGGNAALGVVRQSLTGLKLPRSHKSMKRRFETTPREQLCIFA